MDKTSNPSPAAKDLQAGYQTLRPGTQDLPSKPFRLLLLLPLLFLGGCNMIVMNPGGYRFGDYWRLGIVLMVCWLIVTVTLVPVFWPING